MEHVNCYVGDGYRKLLREMALKRGFVVKRGPYTGQGSIGGLLSAIAEGELTVIKLKNSSAAKS